MSVYSLFYQVEGERVLLLRLLTKPVTEQQIKVSIMCNTEIEAFGKTIKIVFDDFYTTNEETLGEKLLPILQRSMYNVNTNEIVEDNRIIEQLVLIKQVPIPVKFIYFSENACHKLLTSPTDGKEKRGSSQTSNLINTHYEASTSSVEEEDNCFNIQTKMFYGYGISTIINALKHSNASQKDKGDIAELVSFTFTCQKAPDGKYIRNFISTSRIQLTDRWSRRTVEPTLMYIPPMQITDKVKEQYNKFKEHEFYEMLLPYNDFVTQTRFAISSNVPAIDNSIVVQRIAEIRLLLIVRQDKIGYEEDDIIDMVNKGIIRLCETIESWQQYKQYNIDVIYTLAWSRKQSVGKKLISPMANNNFYHMLQGGIDRYIRQHFEGPSNKKLRERISLSIFAENCLSENVINDSINIYQQLAKEDKKHTNNYINICNSLKQLMCNKNFQQNCDTVEYEIFIPDQRYLTEDCTANDIIKKYINIIEIDCLRQRMLKGLQIYNNIQQQQLSDASDAPLSSSSTNNIMPEIGSDDSQIYLDYQWPTHRNH